MIFWLLTATTLAATAACLWWLPALIAPRLPPPAGRMDLGEVNSGDWHGLIAVLLPRPLRIVWNGLIIVAAVALFEGFHLMALQEAQRPTWALLWLYPATLIFHCSVVLISRLWFMQRRSGAAPAPPAPEPTRMERLWTFVMLVVITVFFAVLYTRG